MNARQAADRSVRGGSGARRLSEGKRVPVRRRLLLVDDQTMLLDVLSRQFAQDPALELVGIASDAPSAVEKAAALRPDVVMLDIDLGGSASGFDVLKSMRQIMRPREGAARSRVVMGSMFDNLMYRNRAFELEADAYATKGVRFETLRSLLLDDRSFAVPAGDRGKFWRNDPAVAAGVAKSPLSSLSERERAVVGKIVGGAQEKEVSSLLGISVSSVGTYLRRAMGKLGVATRAELMRFHSAIGS